MRTLNEIIATVNAMSAEGKKVGTIALMLKLKKAEVENILQGNKDYAEQAYQRLVVKEQENAELLAQFELQEEQRKAELKKDSAVYRFKEMMQGDISTASAAVRSIAETIFNEGADIETLEADIMHSSEVCYSSDIELDVIAHAVTCYLVATNKIFDYNEQRDYKDMIAFLVKHLNTYEGKAYDIYLQDCGDCE